MADEIRQDDQKREWIVEFDEKFKKIESTLKNRLREEKKRPEEKKQKEKKKWAEKRENTNIYNIPHPPRKVSFGPYYHGKESCRSTERIKELVVFHTLATFDKKIHDYVKALREVLKDLKDNYDDLDPKWQEDDEGFLRLMIYDGCFLLEVLRAANDNVSDNPVWNIDGVSSNKLMEDYRHDMLLLANQLPMLVLAKLFDVQTDKSKNFIREKIEELDMQEMLARTLNGDILKFIFPRVNFRIPAKKCLHILDLCRHHLLTQELRQESKFQNCLQSITDSFAVVLTCIVATVILFFLLLPVIWVILALVDIIGFPLELLRYLFKTEPATKFHFNIPSATDLNEIGIGFTSKVKSLRNISYGHRTLRLPRIFVDGTTKSMFLNITAFEALHEDAKKEVTSYICFMSSLIKDAADVRHLQRCGVIKSGLSDDEIVQLFKSLTNDTEDDPNNFMVPRYREVSERLTNGFHKMNKPWRKDLFQTYLRSPWAFVSISAAFLLFALTAVQTTFTVLSYYKSK